MTGPPQAGAGGAVERTPLEQELDELAHVSRRKLWLTRLGILAICLVAAYAIVQLVGAIDWTAVVDALGHLALWQLLFLLVPLMARQVLNALPLAFFIPGL